MSRADATGELLAAARAALRASLMPQLSGDGRYQAAMIANALAIAQRELELGPRTRAAEREALAAFYRAGDDSLAELRRRLCADLRAGRLPVERRAELEELLTRLVDARLAISNPGHRAR